MKKICLLIVAATVTFWSCTKTNNASPDSGNQSVVKTTKTPKARYTGSNSQPISISDANYMLQSFLTSINYPENQTTLISLAFDADTLRSYLNNSDIVTLKFMLAHKPDYAENSYGVDAGLDYRAMTLVLVGLDENDNYIYNQQNMVYDQMVNCPNHCSSSATLIQNEL